MLCFGRRTCFSDVASAALVVASSRSGHWVEGWKAAAAARRWMQCNAMCLTSLGVPAATGGGVHVGKRLSAWMRRTVVCTCLHQPQVHIHHTCPRSKAGQARRRIRARSEGWRCDELVWSCRGRRCFDFGRAAGWRRRNETQPRGGLPRRTLAAGRRHVRLHVSPAASTIS